MRSLHRYASDLTVVMVVVHLLREFAYDHYRGVRWFSWLTGLPIVAFLYISGITGYCLLGANSLNYVQTSPSDSLNCFPSFAGRFPRIFSPTATLTTASSPLSRL